MKFFNKTIINSSLILFAFLISFLVAEIFFRFYLFGYKNDPLKIKNWAVEGVWDINKSPVELNYNLGWIPKTGSYKYSAPKHSVTVNKSKLRSNRRDNIEYKSNKVIMFLGNSFTYGDGVNDNETFPSVFESIVKKQTLNAGVPAYGIDQIYLRSLEMIQNFSISDLFLCFIPDNIDRCNNSTFHKVPKPFFNLENNIPVLNSIKTYDFSYTKNFNLSLFHKIGGYSILIDRVMRHFFPNFWFYDIQISKKEEHKDGKKISTMLINSLKRKCEIKNINFFLIPLAHQRYAINQKENLKFVLSHIDNDVKVINIYNQLEKIRLSNPDLFSSYFLEYNYHYSALGNAFVANYIIDELKNKF